MIKLLSLSLLLLVVGGHAFVSAGSKTASGSSISGDCDKRSNCFDRRPASSNSQTFSETSIPVSDAAFPKIEKGVPHELAIWRASRYKDVRYSVTLTLRKKAPVLTGSVEIGLTLVPGSDAPSEKTIILDWRKISGAESSSTVSNIRINGRAVSLKQDYKPDPMASRVEDAVFEHNDHLVFRAGVVEGKNVISLDFTSPILPSGAAVTRYTDAADQGEYVYSLFVPSDASTVLPLIDQPDVKANFLLDLFLPDDWEAVTYADVRSTTVDSKGKAVAAPAGMKFESHYESKRISTYLFSFAAGDFTVFKGQEPTGAAVRGSSAEDEKRFGPSRRSINVYVRRSKADKFKPLETELQELNHSVINYYEGYFDEPFPFPKYDLVLIPDFTFSGMEHVGATAIKESEIIFDSAPSAAQISSRNLTLFHEASHQWFGNLVTMTWFDDLWLKEGFAMFTSYKAMEALTPDANPWKTFYDLLKKGAYATDSTPGTTAIYQKIDNLASAKSAYGNIVYLKAPSFLRQTEYIIGEDNFRTAMRAYLNDFGGANATFQDLLSEFKKARKDLDVDLLANTWVIEPGMWRIRTEITPAPDAKGKFDISFHSEHSMDPKSAQYMKFKVLIQSDDGTRTVRDYEIASSSKSKALPIRVDSRPQLVLPNYLDRSYGRFLLDEKSSEYVMANVLTEQDLFLRSMMWGSLWDSVLEAELDPKSYADVFIKALQKDSDSEGGDGYFGDDDNAFLALFSNFRTVTTRFSSAESREVFSPIIEEILLNRIEKAKNLSTKILAFSLLQGSASAPRTVAILKGLLKDSIQDIESGDKGKPAVSMTKYGFPLTTQMRFKIVERLLSLGDPEAVSLLEKLEAIEPKDQVDRLSFITRAAIGTPGNKAAYWKELTENKEINEATIQTAAVIFNSIDQGDLTLPYLKPALELLPRLKRERKVSFVKFWLSAFISGQRSEKALQIVDQFLADNPDLDIDLRRNVIDISDTLRRGVEIRSKFGG